MGKILLSLFIALGMIIPTEVYSACFEKVALGEYHLGEWGNADGTVIISAIVGSTTKRVSGQNLRRLYRRYLRQCDKKAKKLIKKGKKLFPEQAEQLEQWYLENAEKCKQTFSRNYETLQPMMCSSS